MAKGFLSVRKDLRAPGYTPKVHVQKDSARVKLVWRESIHYLFRPDSRQGSKT
jgi:hypothetical protein